MTGSISYSIGALAFDRLLPDELCVSGVIMGAFEVERVDGCPLTDKDRRVLQATADKFFRMVNTRLGAPDEPLAFETPRDG